MKNTFDLVSRWYWDLVFKLIKYRSLFFAFAFGLFAVVSIQYYQQLNQQITRGYSAASLENIQIKMWAPDKIYIGEEYQDKVEFEVNYDTKIESADVNVIIDLEPTDDNLAYTKDPLIFKLNTADVEERTTNVYYRRTSSSNSTIEIIANITVGDQTTVLSRTATIAKAPHETFAFLSSIIAGVLTIISLIDQIRKW